VDVNLGPEMQERIVVFEGDTAYNLAEAFIEDHGLDPGMVEKLAELLENQLKGLLERIEEEPTSFVEESTDQKQEEEEEEDEGVEVSPLERMRMENRRKLQMQLDEDAI